MIRNIFEGIKNIDRSFIEVGAGLGLTSWQILKYIQIPLALPLMLAGVRTSAVLVVGTATLAAFIGAGGLGDPIFQRHFHFGYKVDFFRSYSSLPFGHCHR